MIFQKQKMKLFGKSMKYDTVYIKIFLRTIYLNSMKKPEQCLILGKSLKKRQKSYSISKEAEHTGILSWSLNRSLNITKSMYKSIAFSLKYCYYKSNEKSRF